MQVAAPPSPGGTVEQQQQAAHAMQQREERHAAQPSASELRRSLGGGSAGGSRSQRGSMGGAGGGGGDGPAGAAEAHAFADDAPARMIRPHISRPPVSRGALHHAAKVLGIHLQGDVATNEISTAKYTILTFLPINLFEQFTRVANLYFLLCAILQLIPGLSPTSWFTTVAPLVFVLAVNAVKEGYDDACRHRNDTQINNRRVIMLEAEQGEVSVFWKDIVAGDLIKVMEGEEVPADLVLLSTPDPEFLCYVETANLDGETNLKIKYCWTPGVTGKTRADEFRGFVDTCVVGCEPPNPRLYVFDGFMDVNGTKYPLDVNNLLLRGSTLRKTPWAIGLAVNVGRDAKIVQNMTKAPRKVTQLERNMNVLVIVQFAVLFVLSAVLAGLDQWWQLQNIPTGGVGINRSWYLRSTGQYPEVQPGVLGFFIMLLRFIILLGNLIPISLYVTLEVVKVFQCALLLNPDRAMYHRDSDTPFVCRTTRLNEELGQVQYVLSDKTGTLTQNVMGWVWASIGGRLYGKAASDANSRPDVPGDTPHTIALDQDMLNALGLREGDAVDDAVDEFLTNLAVCNTVVPSVDATGAIQYQASSPDEEALVEGAAFLGYRLVARTSEEVALERGGKLWTYDVLAVLEFNSDRKRMSLVVRQRWDGRILLMCKGADSIMLRRTRDDRGLEGSVHKHLEEMSRAGLRTLVIAQKEMSLADYEAWDKDFQAASVAIDNREAKVAAASDAVEHDLVLLGATAVEDKLQDGVPECLQALASAGIKVWVLTGDKLETAISIAYSCRLFTEDMGVVELREAELGPPPVNASKASRTGLCDMERAGQVLAAKRAEIKDENARMGVPHGATRVGIVIEGGALGACLLPENAQAFMDMCGECRAVVCCRVSPMQKAQVTNLVKRLAGAITLGIGDGANDVGMIRAAHIGVGISGREGRAAVLSSDFSFAQFRYLSRLLLLHGRWCYLRNQEVVLYSFYKNWTYTMVFVYLQFVAGYSAVPIFTTMLISTFNMIFTACPIVCYAVVEQDLDAATIMGDKGSPGHPETYGLTRSVNRATFFRHFASYIGYGTWHSLAIFFTCFYALASADATTRHGAPGDLPAAGTAVFVSLVWTVTLKLSTRTRAWSWVTCVTYGLSVIMLLPFIGVLGILWPKGGLYSLSDMTGTGAQLLAHPAFWLGAVLLAPAMSLLPDLAVAGFTRYLKPTVAVLLQVRGGFWGVWQVVLWGSSVRG
ncbi:MAG: ATPase, phospholipid transporter [Monoraphidium minutum]|nr:MAG: ATPase, phospholipid transporter [Monoraphidium minutum]